MQPRRGGRLVLRLVTTTVTAVEYDGTLEFDDVTAKVVLRVLLPSGTVEVTSRGPRPPEWLVEQARAALRVAFRATQSGIAWPRRLSRWREAREETGQEEEKSK